MLSKHQKGSIIIPLVIILFVALSVLGLSKFLSSSQANVETAIGSRYQTSLASKMDAPKDWVSVENKNYQYNLFYPKQWVGALTENNKNGVKHYVARHLSNKVSLKLSIYEDYNISQNIKPAKFDKNEFYLTRDEENILTAVAKNNDLFYEIELKEDTYFAESLNFKGTFFHILKKFQFLKN